MDTNEIQDEPEITEELECRKMWTELVAVAFFTLGFLTYIWL